MSRMSAFAVVALMGAFTISAHAETRNISWQGQAIEANYSEPARGLGPTREELLKMARDAVPAVPAYTLPKASSTRQ